MNIGYKIYNNGKKIFFLGLISLSTFFALTSCNKNKKENNSSYTTFLTLIKNINKNDFFLKNYFTKKDIVHNENLINVELSNINPTNVLMYDVSNNIEGNSIDISSFNNNDNLITFDNQNNNINFHFKENSVEKNLNLNDVVFSSNFNYYIKSNKDQTIGINDNITINNVTVFFALSYQNNKLNVIEKSDLSAKCKQISYMPAKEFKFKKDDFDFSNKFFGFSKNSTKKLLIGKNFKNFYKWEEEDYLGNLQIANVIDRHYKFVNNRNLIVNFNKEIENVEIHGRSTKTIDKLDLNLDIYAWISVNQDEINKNNSVIAEFF
ncbi:hypothetical protein JTY60_01845 [symbiont of Argiope bruennichi]|uniref:hypothetical protein n=1 Tax=symbiont of Argiope bruennichi TaxID=2810479 RepID=UPI003DA47E80